MVLLIIINTCSHHGLFFCFHESHIPLSAEEKLEKQISPDYPSLKYHGKGSSSTSRGRASQRKPIHDTFEPGSLRLVQEWEKLSSKLFVISSDLVVAQALAKGTHGLPRSNCHEERHVPPCWLSASHICWTKKYWICYLLARSRLYEMTVLLILSLGLICYCLWFYYDYYVRSNPHGSSIPFFLYNDFRRCKGSDCHN